MVATSKQGVQAGQTLSVARVQARVQPRPIDAISALLLPFDDRGSPDWTDYVRNLDLTTGAGIQPAVNMDTGYIHLLTPDERTQVLRETAQTLQGRPFVAGAFIEGRTGTSTTSDVIAAYSAEAEQILAHGGTPILFQSSALTALEPADIVRVYATVAARFGPVLGFELGTMFAPFGRIYPLALFAELLQIPGLVGLKHSSLDRALEFQRLELRDRVRPDFKVYTGNDLAIDMVMYGSDYLLGLSAFAPEAFGLRDRLWAAGDARFFGLNDVLQYLGAFAFRGPVPAYKHSAAQFLHLRGRVTTANTHPRSPMRPASDMAILEELSHRLDAEVAAIQAGPPVGPASDVGGAVCGAVPAAESTVR
jgi:dihydrodipicolinate synthase/N-acetylneuraminate lyase